MRHSPHVPFARVPGLALALALALPVPAGAAVWREQSSTTLDGRDAVSIEVRNARGRIDVRPSADGAIHVRALKTAHGASQADARRLADQTVVKLTKGPAVRLEVVYPRIVHHVNIWRNTGSDDLPRSDVRFSIEIPARLATLLTVSSGDILTEELAGPQTLRSSSGEIRVLGATGPVNAKTASGDVEVDRARGGRVSTASGSVDWGEALGPLTVSTASGSIEVDDARDSLRASAHSGSIRVGRALGGVVAEASSGGITVREAAGRVDLQTASGSVRAGLLRGTRSATVRSSSGDATVTLDGSAGWTVRARSSSGSIEIDESARVERRSRRDLEARIRGGGAPVEVSTASGSVRVEGGRP